MQYPVEMPVTSKIAGTISLALLGSLFISMTLVYTVYVLKLKVLSLGLDGLTSPLAFVYVSPKLQGLLKSRTRGGRWHDESDGELERAHDSVGWGVQLGGSDSGTEKETNQQA